MKQFWTSFHKAQTEMSDPPMSGKGHHGHYSTLQDVVRAVKPALNANDISFSQGTKHEMTDKGLIISVTTKLVHKNGETHEEELPFLTLGQDPQVIGKIITYGRRYLLGSMCGVVSEDDNDAENTAPAPGKVTPRRSTKELKSALSNETDIFTGSKSDLDQVRAALKERKITDKIVFERVCNALKGKQMGFIPAAIEHFTKEEKA